MELGNGRNQGQTETATGRGAAVLKPVEAAENLLALRLGDAGPGVGHRQPRTLCHHRQPQGDGGTGRRMADGILDQIDEHLRQEVAVAGHSNAGLHPGGDGLPHVLGDRHIGLDHFAAEMRQVDAGKVRPSHPRLDLGDAQEGSEGVRGWWSSALP